MELDLNELRRVLHFNEIDTEEAKSEQFVAEVKSTQLNENFQDCSQSEKNVLLVKQVKTIGEFVLNNLGNDQDLYLDEESFVKSIKVMDIVTINSTRSSCFTKKYKNFQNIF